MAYKNKIYVCFDADEDMDYYNLLKAWNKNENFDFLMYNAHELNNLRDGSKEQTIKRKLKERLDNSKLMIVLIGKNTKYLYKYVRWEIEKAIELGIPIIAANIVKDENGKYKRNVDNDNCPKILKETTALHIPFREKIITKAIDEWPDIHTNYINKKEIGPKIYMDFVYKDLNL
ncbi:TIR domain-containing protein [Parvimonas micra]|uniref:TIR domain-containing protein n=1 Tax=Parvimonas micra TaxID=33033 RepID=UPI00241D9A83|nr:TIR domain-containing protein [Parvimonas micra]